MSELVEDLQREEGDLVFVILFEVEESVAADATASHALDLVHLQNRVLAGGLSVVAKEVVARRDKSWWTWTRSRETSGRSSVEAFKLLDKLNWFKGMARGGFGAGRCQCNGHKLLGRASSAGTQSR